jgi:GH24 family phage-related lysozyme (muramidase)
MMLSLSQDGIDLIHAFEGCVLKIYKDSAGIDTIGWGHRVWPKEIPQFQNGITQEQADALFLKDAAKKENSVRDLIFYPINQGQFDALVSFTFNLGRKNLEQSTLRRMVNEGRIDGAAREFERWIYINKIPSNGLRRRRKAESLMFMGDLKWRDLI